VTIVDVIDQCPVNPPRGRSRRSEAASPGCRSDVGSHRDDRTNNRAVIQSARRHRHVNHRGIIRLQPGGREMFGYPAAVIGLAWRCLPEPRPAATL
jgi:hypothetical protein